MRGGYHVGGDRLTSRVSTGRFVAQATGGLILVRRTALTAELDVLCGWPVVRVEGVAPRQVNPFTMFGLFPTRNSLVRASP